MARTTKRFARKPRRVMRKKRMMRKRKNDANYAQLKETIQLNELVAEQPYASDLNLTQFARAVNVAQSYQLYRIAYVEYRIKPRFDTFLPASPSTNVVPYLYWIMNRNASTPQYFDDDYLIQQGARAIRLDDKTIKINYKPNIVIDTWQKPGGGAYYQSGMPKITPWLPTQRAIDDPDGNPPPVTPLPVLTGGSDDTLHYGHLTYISAPTWSSEVKVCDVEVTVTFQFKKPFAVPPANPTNQKTISMTKTSR